MKEKIKELINTIEDNCLKMFILHLFIYSGYYYAEENKNTFKNELEKAISCILDILSELEGGDK